MTKKFRRLSRYELKELAEHFDVPLYEGMDINEALSLCYWLGRVHERRNQESHGKEVSKDDK